MANSPFHPIALRRLFKSSVKKPWFFVGDFYIPLEPYPIGSMYGIYANIWGILMVNVTIYTIHGSWVLNGVFFVFEGLGLAETQLLRPPRGHWKSSSPAWKNASSGVCKQIVTDAQTWTTYVLYVWRRRSWHYSYKLWRNLTNMVNNRCFPWIVTIKQIRYRKEVNVDLFLKGILVYRRWKPWWLLAWKFRWYRCRFLVVVLEDPNLLLGKLSVKSNMVTWYGYPLVNVYITMERSTIFNGKIHYKLPFSIAMLVYQRVILRMSFFYILYIDIPTAVMIWTCRTCFCAESSLEAQHPLPIFWANRMLSCSRLRISSCLRQDSSWM